MLGNSLVSTAELPQRKAELAAGHESVLLLTLAAELDAECTCWPVEAKTGPSAAVWEVTLRPQVLQDVATSQFCPISCAHRAPAGTSSLHFMLEGKGTVLLSFSGRISHPWCLAFKNELKVKPSSWQSKKSLAQKQVQFLQVPCRALGTLLGTTSSSQSLNWNSQKGTHSLLQHHFPGGGSARWGLW